MLNIENRIDLYDDVSNPLDGIEEIMLNNDWTFNRMSQDEMTVHISGKQGNYKMAFIWQDAFHSLQFCCAPDLTISENKLSEATQVLNKVNAGLWLGHFDIRATDNEDIDISTANVPCFRHTSLFRGMNGASGIDHMEDLIDIAIHECERYYPTFNLLSLTKTSSEKDMSLALMDVAGVS